MVYLSDRKIPLLCQEPDSFGRVIVTMENYMKWYGVKLLHPNGQVENADSDLMNDLERKAGKCLMGNHNYHPQLLNLIAEHYKGVADWRAIEMTAGRWMMEIDEGPIGGVDTDHPYSHTR